MINCRYIASNDEYIKLITSRIKNLNMDVVNVHIERVVRELKYKVKTFNDITMEQVEIRDIIKSEIIKYKLTEVEYIKQLLSKFGKSMEIDTYFDYIIKDLN